MITKNSLIFIVEDDKPYGNLVRSFLKKSGYEHVTLFHDERDCLNNLSQHPEVIISDYHLNYMSGLKLIQEARKKSSGFYTILLSGAYHIEKFSDDIPVQKVDKYIIKGENEFQILTETLNDLTISKSSSQYY